MGNKLPLGAFNKMLRTPKPQNGYRAHEVTLLRVEIKETCRINSPRSKPHFSPWIKKKKKKKKNTRVLRDYCGVQEFKLGICATCHAHG